MAIFGRPSNLAEDAVVNTWHFDTAAIDLATAAQELSKDLGAFYVALRPIMSSVLRTLAFRFYDLGTPAPRAPVQGTFATWTPPPTSFVPLPAEVALALSFYSSRNLPRQRGRIYVGPLNTSASGSIAAGDVDVRPSTSAVQSVADAAKLLADNVSVKGMRLGVFSTVDNLLRPVTAGWVDNGYDTQRRRGGKATSRTLWTPTPAG